MLWGKPVILALKTWKVEGVGDLDSFLSFFGQGLHDETMSE